MYSIVVVSRLNDEVIKTVGPFEMEAQARNYAALYHPGNGEVVRMDAPWKDPFCQARN
jgi:hypothetical protein